MSEGRVAEKNEVRYVEVPAASEGQRIDNFLLRELKGLPKSRLYRLIRKGEVRINKKRTKPEYKLAAGDVVRIPPVRLGVGSVPALPGAGLRDRLLDSVLFEGEDFLVINKPAGLAVHGGSGVHLGLIEAMRQLKPRWQDLELAHRLDRETSGCLLISKNTLFIRYMHKELKAKNVDKTYLALVVGQWPQSLTEVNAPLRKNELLSGERMVRVQEQGKSALTRYRVIRRFRGATLVEAMPVTGRTHQIRVHCQHAGHPILGDSKYFELSGHESPLPGKVAVKTLCLHALRLQFKLPEGGPVAFDAPLNPVMSGIMDSLGEHSPLGQDKRRRKAAGKPAS
ncbi:MAG: RluA family pseudouridine synthase [Pseudohongiellaceae bacterium]